MTRTPHDSFAKEWMQEVLADFGEIEVEKQIAGEVRKIDLYFCPHPGCLTQVLRDKPEAGLRIEGK